jgi:hypothetical protein
LCNINDGAGNDAQSEAARFCRRRLRLLRAGGEWDVMSTIFSAYAARVRRTVAVASRPNWSARIAKAIASVLVFGPLSCASPPAWAQFTQQGAKLVGTGFVSAGEQGSAVALSADGNTAIVGGHYDNEYAGAAWVFIRNAGVWTQQGSKLVGTGAVGRANQGVSVALSADGNTAIVGGEGDNGAAGAAWVFIRSGGVWTQQRSKLVGSGALPGTGAVTGAWQGHSVAISADGNTAIVGGWGDNKSAGAAWVFTRSGGVWTQQGSKLVGSGAVGSAAAQGFSVALSADGNTAIVGGENDNNLAGAAWVFIRSGGLWTQQGSKLVGGGAVGSASQGSFQGSSVALSADGNTAIVGGWGDNNSAGAAWVFTRSGGVWTQQGSKVVGTGAVGSAFQGFSVALSADGNTAIVGGYVDNDIIGAAWVFTRSGGVWTQLGPKLVGSGADGKSGQGTSVALSGDGNTAAVGGVTDHVSGTFLGPDVSGLRFTLNWYAGAVWVFVQPNAARKPDGAK